MKFTNRMLAGAAALVFVAIMSACGGGTAIADAAKLTQAQFDTFLKSSVLYVALTGDVSDLKTAEANDAATIKRIAIFGHNHGTTSANASAVRTESMNAGNGGIVTQAVSFGPCPDMGQHVQDSGNLAEFRQCAINGHQYFYDVVDDGSGSIGAPQFLWYSDATCGQNGGHIIAFTGDTYPRARLASGTVFVNPADGTQWKVTEGDLEASRTSGSVWTSGSCSVDVETNPGYVPTHSTLEDTGVPIAVDPKFTY